MPLARRWPIKARVDFLHQPIASNKNGRRIRAEVHELRQLLRDVVVFGRAAEQHQVGDAVFLIENFDLFQIAFRVARILERKPDDFQTLRLIAGVQIFQQWCFIIL